MLSPTLAPTLMPRVFLSNPRRCPRRESADPKRIQERHRKMLIANHPDMGGSTFLAGKINEAKDVLLKGPSAASGSGKGR